MKIPNIILILLVIPIFGSCKNNNKTEISNQSEPKEEKSELTDSNCPKIQFKKELSPNISLSGFYYKCESLWKQNIEFIFNGEKVYKTDSLNEYQFKAYSFPVLINDGELSEILLERDDRPLKNYLEVFRFKKNVLDSIYKIPFFEMEPKDIDDDGIKEYYATLEMVELLEENGNIGYNPILAYEISETKLTFDLNATKIANEKTYDQFYVLKIDNSLKFNGNEVQKNWP
ncbi:MAG: hypothetical protein ABJ218_13940 [Winogradskyella arenosi]